MLLLAALLFALRFSAWSALDVASSNSSWALRYLAKFVAAISSAVSICFLNALILLSNVLILSCKRDCVFLSSSVCDNKSFNLFSIFFNWLVVSEWFLASLSLSASNSRTLSSNFWTTRLPPLSELPSACSNLACKSATCDCKLFLALSAAAYDSLCELTCSVNLATSFEAVFNLASEFLNSVFDSSKSLRKCCKSFSNLRFNPLTLLSWPLNSLLRSVNSRTSDSNDLCALSDCSKATLPSSICTERWMARRSDKTRASLASLRCFCSSSIWACNSLTVCCTFLFVFVKSTLFLFEAPNAISNSFISASNAFFCLCTSILAFVSVSKLACTDSIARAWLRLYNNFNQFIIKKKEIKKERYLLWLIVFFFFFKYFSFNFSFQIGWFQLSI